MHHLSIKKKAPKHGVGCPLGVAYKVLATKSPSHPSNPSQLGKVLIK